MQQQSDGASEKDDAARERVNDTKLSAAKQATDEGASVSHLNLIIEEKERTVSVLKIAVQALQGQVQSGKMPFTTYCNEAPIQVPNLIPNSKLRLYFRHMYLYTNTYPFAYAPTSTNLRRGDA